MDLHRYQEERERSAIHQAEVLLRQEDAQLGPADQRDWRSLLCHEVLGLASTIEADQYALRADTGRLPRHGLPLLALHAETLALLALRAIVNHVVDSDGSKKPGYTDVAVSLGKDCYQEWHQRRARAVRDDLTRSEVGLPDLAKFLMQRHSAANAGHRVRKQVQAFEGCDWVADGCGSVLGGYLLEKSSQFDLIEVLEEHHGLHGVIRRIELGSRLSIAAGATSAGMQPSMLVRPSMGPMLVPPRPWRGLRGGGFLTTDGIMGLADLVKHRGNRRQVALLEECVTSGRLDTVLRAVNALQATPWRLNRPLLALLQLAWTNNLPLPGLPDRERQVALAEQLQPLWTERRLLIRRQNALTVAELEARREDLHREWEDYRRKRQEAEWARSEWSLLLGTRIRLEGLLESCAELEAALRESGADRFYFPFQLDYRGRAYAMVALLSPQSDERSRALLQFADGKPLGANGAYWLAVHVANTYGKDKVSFDERVAWVRQSEPQLQQLFPHGLQQLLSSWLKDVVPNTDQLPQPPSAVADHFRNLPPHCLAFWAVAKRPWCFFAAALEWLQRDSPGFVSHLPIALDASASGIQHLSALARDREGAQATNLLYSERPQDIYQRVAGAVSGRVDVLAAAGDQLALFWRGRVDRTVVKRGVMTTPYGVTSEGLRGQIVEVLMSGQDLATAHSAEPYALASFLAPVLHQAIGDVLKGQEIMLWLRHVTDVLCKSCAMGVWWTAPSGFPVVVEHHCKDQERYTWTDRSGKRHELLLRIAKPELPIDQGEQHRTIAPNFIHALDASHLALVVSRLHRAELHHFATIHDSFAVHAADIPSLRVALREEFVRMHRPRLLDSFLEEQVGHVGLEQRERVEQLCVVQPVPGDLDLDEILRSRYMFS